LIAKFGATISTSKLRPF